MKNIYLLAGPSRSGKSSVAHGDTQTNPATSS